jgi:DNA-directed RNA polymerase beta subunit
MPVSEAVKRRIVATLKKSTTAPPSLDEQEDVFGDRDYVPIGINGLMAASEKLLHVNQGVTDPDDRDDQQFKRLYSTPHLLRERIRLDADKVKRNLIRFAARRKNLQPAHAFMFDPYMDGHLSGNPLTLPLEEINPMHILEQARRITQMGPGGIGSSDSITPGMQAVKTSEMGFVSPIEGPESSAAGIDVRAAWGTRYGRDGRLYQKVRDRRTGKLVWVSSEDLDQRVLSLPK